jgi:hypothetical protein
MLAITSHTRTKLSHDKPYICRDYGCLAARDPSASNRIVNVSPGAKINVGSQGNKLSCERLRPFFLDSGRIAMIIAELRPSIHPSLSSSAGAQRAILAFRDRLGVTRQTLSGAGRSFALCRKREHVNDILSRDASELHAELLAPHRISQCRLRWKAYHGSDRIGTEAPTT